MSVESSEEHEGGCGTQKCEVPMVVAIDLTLRIARGAVELRTAVNLGSTRVAEERRSARAAVKQEMRGRSGALAGTRIDAKVKRTRTIVKLASVRTAASARPPKRTITARTRIIGTPKRRIMLWKCNNGCVYVCETAEPQGLGITCRIVEFLVRLVQPRQLMS